MSGIKELHASIEAMFGKTDDTEPQDVFKRLLSYAQRGVDQPESLSALEIKQVCYALIIHYAQVGID